MYLIESFAISLGATDIFFSGAARNGLERDWKECPGPILELIWDLSRPRGKFFAGIIVELKLERGICGFEGVV